MYRTNIHILVSAKCLDSPCTVCFLLSSCSTFNGMYCSCYYCLVIVVTTLLTVLSLFASHPGFLSIVSARTCRIVSSHVSLYARVNSFFILPPTPSSLSLSSPFCLFSGRKSPVIFSQFSRPREIHARLALSRIIRSRLSIVAKIHFSP